MDRNKDPLPDDATQAEMAKVPERILRNVKSTFEVLNHIAVDHERYRTVDKNFGSEGRYEHEFLEKIAPNYIKLNGSLKHFRELAEKNGVNVDLIFNHYGPAPVIIESRKAAEWAKPEDEKLPFPIEADPNPAVDEPTKTQASSGQISRENFLQLLERIRLGVESGEDFSGRLEWSAKPGQPIMTIGGFYQTTTDNDPNTVSLDQIQQTKPVAFKLR